MSYTFEPLNLFMSSSTPSTTTISNTQANTTTNGNHQLEFLSSIPTYDMYNNFNFDQTYNFEDMASSSSSSSSSSGITSTHAPTLPVSSNAVAAPISTYKNVPLMSSSFSDSEVDDDDDDSSPESSPEQTTRQLPFQMKSELPSFYSIAPNQESYKLMTTNTFSSRNPNEALINAAVGSMGTLNHTQMNTSSPSADSASEAPSPTQSPTLLNGGLASMSVSNSPMISDMSEKQKKLKRKAELARLQRKKKKTRMQDLESEVQRLTAEIEHLKKSKTSSSSAASSSSSSSLPSTTGSAYVNSMVEDNEQVQLHIAINSLIQSSQNQSEEQCSKQMETFVQTVNRHISATSAGLSQVQSALAPMLPLQFLTWACSQQDKFVESPTSLWNSLFVQELNLTNEQIKDLLGLRTSIKKQKNLVTELEKTFKKLSKTLSAQIGVNNENFIKLRSILTNKQIIKFFDWVNRYGKICMMAAPVDHLQNL